MERIKNFFRRERLIHKEDPMPAGEWKRWEVQTFQEDLLGWYLKKLGNDTAAQDIALHPEAVRTKPELHKLFVDTVIAEERMGLVFERWAWPLVINGNVPFGYNEELAQARTNMLADPEAWIHTWYDNMVKLNMTNQIGGTA